MSLFRRPKKAIVQRRVFSAADDEENIDDRSENENQFSNRNESGTGKMEIEERMQTPPPPSISDYRKQEKKSKDVIAHKKSNHKKSSLLSFGDEEEEEEVFQVKKSSHSKKVMRMMDKERRKKKSHQRASSNEPSHGESNQNTSSKSNNGFNSKSNAYDVAQATSNETASRKGVGNNDYAIEKRQKSINSNIHTEIRTEDFVLVVKKTETQPNVVLNGRAALCAGRDDMSSEDGENDSDNDDKHRFKRPSSFKTLLESGTIPDATMIHEARKKRQKARELGDFVALDENKTIDNKKGRLIREEAEDDCSEDERVDMSAITGAKELEERREQFYAVENDESGDESDADVNEWESQQIRKAISGSQLMSAQQEAYSHFIMKDESTEDTAKMHASTGILLEKAYASGNSEKTKFIKLQQKVDKKLGPKTPQQIFESIKERFANVKQLNESHLEQINKITTDLNVIKLEELESEQNAPIVASKFQFFQVLRGYVLDLVECYDEKLPKIVDLEKRFFIIIAKHANFLIERRRQDVRDQASEVTQMQKSSNLSSMNNAAKKEEEQRIQRAAEREGRRTRRRRDRERIDVRNSHLDGMSSDDEIPDHEINLYKNQLKQLEAESKLIFEDVNENFCDLAPILSRFERWRERDMSSYKDSYFSLCLPKIVGPVIRANLITWNPFEDNCKDLERTDWYETIMKYGYKANETEANLNDDPDIRLIPTLIEKIILPKVNEFVEKAWDPLSSTQTLKLVNLIRRLHRDYPSLKPKSKYMRTLFTAILDKIKLSVDNDVFIPIFPKQLQEAKCSFFQRQFSSALKLLRNLLSWEGILSDSALKEIAISSLLNRYLLSAIRICATVDAVGKSHIIVNTLPRVWLQQASIIESLELFIQFLRTLMSQLDRKNSMHSDPLDKLNKIFNTFHLTSTPTT